MSPCPPSVSTPSTQALCQGAIKPANACRQHMPLPRSAPVVECDLPSPLKCMRRYQAMTGMGPGCVETALDFGAGDSALGESALEILKLGASGVGDASVHRWRRSDRKSTRLTPVTDV